VNHLETDVLVVGGGCTGTGVARDLALRGLRVVLAERDDIAFGTSGRNHGLLHSGGRYAVKDAEAAAECIAENRVLRRIARHAIWDSGGLFVLLEGDDPGYAEQLVAACGRLGIEAEELARDEALRLEPGLPRELVRAIAVPDGMIDPFSLCLSNALDAAERGAAVLVHHALVGLEQRGGAIASAVLRDRLNGEEVEVRPRMVVNAAGAWAGQVAALAGLRLDLFLSKGSLLIASHRAVRRVINRCRLPGSGDILVPGGPVTVLGTTSVTVDDPGDFTTSGEEVALLRREAERLAPVLAGARVLRAFAGVRPLYQENASGADGRAVSRGHAVIDHQRRDGLAGLVSIVGGKLTTYRKMAQDVSDLVCGALGNAAPCRTAELPLPGSEAVADDAARPRVDVPRRTLRMAQVRHGGRAAQVLAAGAGGDADRLGHVCLCESVTEAEVRHSVSHLWARTLDDVRRRTRVGCGPCQGTYCGPRVASVMAEQMGLPVAAEVALAEEFDLERRRGEAGPSLAGDQTIQVALAQAVRRAAGHGPARVEEGTDEG
jgi:glycerol-3-phosphate dehydrogenase